MGQIRQRERQEGKLDESEMIGGGGGGSVKRLLLFSDG
jgi:hypothetical protein